MGRISLGQSEVLSHGPDCPLRAEISGVIVLAGLEYEAEDPPPIVGSFYSGQVLVIKHTVLSVASVHLQAPDIERSAWGMPLEV